VTCRSCILLESSLQVDTLGQFLKHDRQVLRFFCVWDDSSALYGDQHEMVMHYYLADDTVEIKERYPRNSGHFEQPVFLRRQRLPRYFDHTAAPGEPAKNGDLYYEDDFFIGARINVYGRPFLIFDMDEASQHFYRSKYGVTDFTPIQVRPPPAAPQPREFPPHIGIGDPADSLGSCLSLIPKPPKKDFVKMLTKDGQVMRFSARMRSSRPADAERRFIVSYFLSDDTLLIYEPRQRNSGLPGGKFSHRRRVQIPGSERFYNAADLRVGAVVEVEGRQFEIVDADEHTHRLMLQEDLGASHDMDLHFSASSGGGGAAPASAAAASGSASTAGGAGGGYSFGSSSSNFNSSSAAVLPQWTYSSSSFSGGQPAEGGDSAYSYTFHEYVTTSSAAAAEAAAS
jgi:hypothetical protein